MKKFTQKGFTLIEVLVVMSIFAITSVIISNIYMQASNLQRQTENLQKLQNEGRYVLEKIAKEVRERELDLPYTDENPTTTLAFLADEDNNVLKISYNPSSNPILSYIITDQNHIDHVGSLDFNDSVKIVDMKFYVYPTRDSMGQPVMANLQPRVTVMLKLKNTQNSAVFSKELNLQTTISSKYYR